MSAEPSTKSWLQTLPGIVTSITAALTAIAGLVVAVKQTGWLDKEPVAETQATPPNSAPPSPALASSTGLVSSTPPSPSTPTAAPPAAQPRAVALPQMRDYKLGPADIKATFSLLKAELAPATSETDSFVIRLRMTNHDRYDHVFWVRSFALLVDGVPQAPENDLNELVQGGTAKEGDVVFSVPRGLKEAKLRITYYEKSTEIPFSLASAGNP